MKTRIALVILMHVALPARAQMFTVKPTAIARPAPFDFAAAVAASLAPVNSYGFRVATAVVEIPPGEWHVRSRPDLQNAHGLTIRGSGPHSKLVLDWDDPNGVGLDFTGAAYCRLERFTVGRGGNLAAGIMFARRPEANPRSANAHRIDGVSVEGPWTYAAAVTIASESNLWLDCTFQTIGLGSCMVVTNAAPRGLDVSVGMSTMQRQAWRDCRFLSNGPPGSAPPIRLIKQGVGVVTDLVIDGGDMGVTSARVAALSLEDIGQPGQLQDVHVRNVRWECGPVAHVIQAIGDGAREFWRVTLDDSTVYASGDAVYAPGMTLAGWRVSGLNSWIDPGAVGYLSEYERVAVVAAWTGPTIDWPIGRPGQWNRAWAPQSLAQAQGR